LALRRKLLEPEHPLIAESLNNLAQCHLAQANYIQADSLLRGALAIWRRTLGPEHLHVATAMNNFGVMVQRQGDYVRAEPLLREALRIARRVHGAEHPVVATLTDNLGVLLLDQGDHHGAELLCREGLAIRRKVLSKDHALLAFSLNNLAVLLWDRGDCASAERLYREALSIRRMAFGDGHYHTARSLNNLARLLAEKGDHIAAERMYRKALAICREQVGHEHPLDALILSNLGDLYLDQRDHRAAEQCYREALLLRRRLLGEEHPYVVRSYWQLARVLITLGDYAVAESVLVLAAQTYDVARLRAGSGYKRATFLNSPYTSLAGVRLLLGEEVAAWPAAEKALGRCLADLILTAEHRGLSAAEIAREDSLNRILGVLENEIMTFRLFAGGDSTPGEAQRAERVRTRLLAAEAAWGSFQRELAAKYPLTEGEAYALGRVQAALSPHSAIVGWVEWSTENAVCEVWGYVIRNVGPVAWTCVRRCSEAGAADGQSSTARSLRAKLAVPGVLGFEAPPEARDLWLERIKPLTNALQGVHELMVVPSGAMLGVPIEALVDDQRTFLGEHYAVTYVPSATLYVWLKERSTQSQVRGRILLLGDPPFTAEDLSSMEGSGHEEPGQVPFPVTPEQGDRHRQVDLMRSPLSGDSLALASLPRLPGTRHEINQIAEVCPHATILLGPAASEQRLLSLASAGRLKTFEAIHLATHALVDNRRPERSALVLSQVNLPDPLEAALTGRPILDGLVTAKEVVRRWELDADLVTLSACETGLGVAIEGEGYIGLAHAFLQAGARSLLVSLWHVQDEATSLLMRRFYMNRFGALGEDHVDSKRDRMSKAKALQEAKRWLRSHADPNGNRPFGDPYYWAGFVLIGEGG
jgi:CHAT domain-containing protein/tetratricopeptide (TPR) repeat protein